MTNQEPTNHEGEPPLVLLPLPLPAGETPGGIIFDCDGTLADTMPLHYHAWTATLLPHDTPFPEPLFYEWGGVTTHEIVQRLNKIYNRTLSPEEVMHAKEELYRGLIPDVRPIDLVVAEVTRFYGKCPLAVASGGLHTIITQTLATLGIAHYFQTVVTADDVKRGKPAPDTFLLAAERLGVAPSECVVYEDSPSGLEAARRAGMRAVDVRPYLQYLQETKEGQQ